MLDHVEVLRRRVVDGAHDAQNAGHQTDLAVSLRNVSIRKAHAAGITQTELATLTGLTRQRIQQICGKDEGR